MAYDVVCPAMNLTEPVRAPWHPATEEERELVRRELGRVLKTPQFTSSKRYPAFLRYIVENELEGHSEWLKERTIGVEVFHRSPDYDTGNDTIVRFTASEVRRRLTLTYHEPVAGQSVQITLPIGSYVPEFVLIPEHTAAGNLQAPLREDRPQPPTASDRTFRPWRWTSWQLGILALLLVGVSVGPWFLTQVRGSTPTDAMTKFWRPLENSSSPVLICPGSGAGALQTFFPPPSVTINKNYRYVSVEMERAVADLTYLFGVRHVKYLVQLPSEVNLTELRENLVLLVGAYSNKWTLQLVNNLRFRFASQPAEIDDATNPSVHWGTQGISPDNGVDDFSLIARYHDSITDTVVVMVAGLGSSGTEAAAEFVTSPRYLEQLNRSLPPGWEKKNVEVVLESRVIEGKSSEPSIKATYVW